jgi:hypothetical protein
VTGRTPIKQAHFHQVGCGKRFVEVYLRNIDKGDSNHQYWYSAPVLLLVMMIIFNIPKDSSLPSSDFATDPNAARIARLIIFLCILMFVIDRFCVHLLFELIMILLALNRKLSGQ